MDNAVIIEPGLWIKKSTINSETKEIIRIIGEDPNREGYWLIADSGNVRANEYPSMSDYEIEREYELFQALNSYKKPAKKLRMGDIDEKPVERPIQQQAPKPFVKPEQPRVTEEESNRYTQTQHKKVEIPSETKVVYKERRLEEQIFDKIKNEQKDEVEFHINVKDLPNLTKLRNTADFLNLDKELLADLYVNEMQDVFLKSLKDVIVKELSIKSQSPTVFAQNSAEEPEQTEEHEVVEEPEVVEEVDDKEKQINDGIGEIDEFIKTL